MKHLLLSLFALSATSAHAQHSLQKLWETDSVVAVPESVALDAKQNLIYISLIDGEPWGVDGKGGVATLDISGKNYNGSWISGLNAPKGLGFYGNNLYAADISDVVVVDRVKGNVIKKIAIPDGEGLNDIAVSAMGAVYVSDSKTGKIWKIVNDVPVLYVENLTGANGLETVKNDLIYANGKDLMRVDSKKQTTKLATVPQGIDGIDAVGNGDFIVSSWSGHIYYVTAAGKVDTLLDSEEQHVNTADIAYDAASKTLFVPTFFAKKIVAYKVQ